MSANEWIDIITKYQKHRADKVPDGWFTRDQISKKIGKSKTTTKDYLTKLSREGNIDKKDFYIYIPARKSSTPVPHYKIKCTN